MVNLLMCFPMIDPLLTSQIEKKSIIIMTKSDIYVVMSRKVLGL